MKLLIAGLTTGLLFTATPALADRWKDESGHGWRRSHQETRHWDQRWERGRHHSDRHRHWSRHRHHHHYYPRHHSYRNYSYSYPAPSAYVGTPSIYFSWSSGY